MERKKDGFEGQRAIVLPQSIKKVVSENELTSLLYITDIGFYPKACGHFRSREKGAEQHILIYCTAGRGWISINGVRHELHKDDFLVIEAGLPHSYGACADDPWTIYWLHFSGEKSHLFRQIYNRVIRIDEAPEARLGDRLLMFEEMYSNLEMGYSTENLEYATLCLWHFIASFRFVSQYREVNRLRKGDVIQDAIKFMRNNLQKKLSLQEIAGSVHYSPSHFGQIFLKKTGSTPLNYFNQLKIQKACQMLDFSEMKIKDIASELGFYDQYHFSKMFIRQVGETPTHYRNRNKG